MLKTGSRCIYNLTVSVSLLMQDDSTDSEAEFEQLKKVAQIKYASFRQEFSHILDPNDDAELKKMEEMGLPVVFINSRGGGDVSVNLSLLGINNLCKEYQCL